MSDKLINFGNLKPSKLKRKNGKYQQKKSIRKVAGGSKDTKPELQVQQILIKMGIEFVKQWQVENKFYDLYIPSLNLLIEVDGTYWHGKDVEYTKKSKMQKRNFHNDRKKDGLATKHGYKIKRIWEGEITKTNVKKLLEE